MAAPNAQPCGSRPGPGTVHEHEHHEAGMPASAKDVGTKLTPGNTKPVRQNPVAGGNSNALH